MAAEGGAGAGGVAGGSFAGLTCSAPRKSIHGARLFVFRRNIGGIPSLLGGGSQGKVICTPLFSNSLG